MDPQPQQQLPEKGDVSGDAEECVDGPDLSQRSHQCPGVIVQQRDDWVGSTAFRGSWCCKRKYWTQLEPDSGKVPRPVKEVSQTCEILREATIAVLTLDPLPSVITPGSRPSPVKLLGKWWNPLSEITGKEVPLALLEP